MKKIIVFTSAVLSVFLISCSSPSSSSDGGSGSTQTSTLSMNQSATWNYSSTNDTFVVNEDVKAVSINGNLGGKTLYYAAVNTSSADIESGYMKYIGSLSSRNAISEETSAIADDSQSSNAAISPMFDWQPDMSGFNSSNARTLDNPITTVGQPVNQLSYTDGTTTKKLYVVSGEDSSGNPVHTKSKAVLYAHNDACNIWFVHDEDTYTDGYFTTDSEKTAIAQKFASVFEAFAPVERHVFGNESDLMYYSYDNTGWTTAPMNYLSDTGTKVNIVLYDLYNDANAGKVLGFFYGADYYPTDDDFSTIIGTNYNLGSYSNEGKYFYIDTYFAKTSEAETILTLAHEFQHMIHFGVKRISAGLNSDTNFNEMCSMLCEDMLNNFIESSISTTIPDTEKNLQRFYTYCVKYFYTGIRGYDNNTYTAVSYANAYAFGSWLCRQYGGAALVKEMMSNGKTNNECIVAAVNALNSTNYTFNDLFGQFIKACYNKDSTCTHNQDAAQTLTYSSGSTSYSYPMTAINLENYDLTQAFSNGTALSQILKTNTTNSSGVCFLDSDYQQSFKGPAIFVTGAIMKLPATYGLMLKKYGTIEAGLTEANLIFGTNSGSTKSGMKIYLYIK